MRKQELEAQADRIEMVLHQYKASAQVTGGTVTLRISVKAITHSG